MEEYNLANALALRFVRGFAAGMVGSFAALSPVVFNSWADVHTWLITAGFAALSGGLTGGILALDKYLRSN
jgi:hypothetical protein